MTVQPPRRPFTGRHMTIILVAFFGVVVGVNLLMARFAISGFGGTVVDNSYVASQHYNERLAAGRAARALGWHAAVTRNPAGHIEISATGAGDQPFAGQVEAVIRPALGRVAPTPLALEGAGDGRFVSRQALPAVRSTVLVTMQAGGHVVRQEVALP